LAQIGSPTISGPVIAVPGAAQALTATGTITISSEIVPISSAAAITLTSTPTIAPGTSGQKIALFNSGNFPITLQDRGTLSGSTVALINASNLTLVPGQVILFWFLGGSWIQLNNPPTAPVSPRREFQNSDLTSGVYRFLHGLATRVVSVSVYDNNGKRIDAPDSVDLAGAGTTASPWRVDINMTSYAPLTGTWSAIVNG
jgi:hypothetical protein